VELTCIEAKAFGARLREVRGPWWAGPRTPRPVVVPPRGETGHSQLTRQRGDVTGTFINVSAVPLGSPSNPGGLSAIRR
jgi:hypothetical protein